MSKERYPIHIFVQNRDYCDHYPSNICVKMFAVWDVFFSECSLVLLNEQKKDFPSSVTATKPSLISN